MQRSKVSGVSGEMLARVTYRKLGILVGSLVVLAAMGLVYGRLQGAATAAPREETGTAPVPVTAGIAVARDMPVYVRGIGSVQAFNSVAVKSRVDGQIVKVDFTEGQEVKAGDLLFEIDPRPFDAAIAQAQANEQKDEAQLASATADLRRDAELLRHGNQTKQAYDQQKALVGQVEAAIKADQAQVETAQLNRDYADIRSPIDGRTGARQVDIGNIVHATDSAALATITQLRPIFVSFTAPQGQFDAVRRAMVEGTVAAQAWSENERREMAEGRLTLIDNQIDQATGTVHLKATFDNRDEALWPGAFVDMRLVVETLKNAVTVPARTVQEGPDGKYLYVIKPDNTVEMRKVDVAEVEGDVAAIVKGLAVGERVVVDGQYRLSVGARVTIVPQNASAGAAGGDGV